jgi:DNA-binding beta-propeller fold protein YncE
MRVGTGDFVYEVITEWGRLPAGWAFGSVPNGACDSQGRVYLFARGSHPVLVFDPEGNFLGSWGETVFSRPHGILITPDDIAYCTDDKDHTVRKCTLDGKVLMTLGTKDQPSDTGYDGKEWRTIQRGNAPFNRPTQVALSPAGEIYVSDGYGNARVHKFTPEGELMFSWGEPGTGPGQFSIVHAVCTDKNGVVYIADRENSRIQVFTPEGKFIEAWTEMQKPQGFYLGPDGLLYTTEKPVKRQDGATGFLPPRVSIWNTSGRLLARWGGEDLAKPGNFFAPHGIWGDARGDLYVGELSIDGLRGDIPPGYPLVHKLVRVK